MLEQQLKIRRNSVKEQIKYFGSNIIFCGITIYSCIFGTQGSIWKIVLVVMAVMLLLMSTWHRNSLKPRARRALRLLQAGGQIAQGYIGLHTLELSDGKASLRYGTSSQTIDCADIIAFDKLDHAVSLRARDGAIFDIIPDNFDGSRSKETFRRIRDEIEQEAVLALQKKDAAVTEKWSEQALMKFACEVDTVEFIQGQVLGQRYYYSTARPWIKGAMIRLIILIYGIGLAASGQSRLLALAFIVAGLLLSRQLLITFTPVAYIIAKKRFEKAAAGAAGAGTMQFFVTPTELIEYCFHNEQAGEIAEIRILRSGRGYQFIYMNSGQMFVIPNRIFADQKEKLAFMKKLKKDKK